MLRNWRFTISIAVLLMSTLALAACGGSPTAEPLPTPTPFNMEELRSLIQDAVSESMPDESGEPAITEAQLQELVQDAVAASMTPGLTAEDVEELVQAAVESAMMPGVSLAEVEEVIAAALAAEANRMSPPEALVIYSGRSESLVDAIIQQFSQATGIPVEVKYAGTAQLAATLLEEGDNSPADIFFAQDPGGLGAIEGMLAILPDRVLSRVPEWARSSQGRWVGLSGRAPHRGLQSRKNQRRRIARRRLGFCQPRVEEPHRLGANQRLIPDYGNCHARIVGRRQDGQLAKRCTG